MLARNKVGVKQHAQIAGTLNVFAELDKMPSFVVIHGSGGNSVESVRAFSDQVHHPHGACVIMRVQLKASDVMEKAIQMLPHVGTDLLANLTGIFAGRTDALHNRKSTV